MVSMLGILRLISYYIGTITITQIHNIKSTGSIYAESSTKHTLFGYK